MLGFICGYAAGIMSIMSLAYWVSRTKPILFDEHFPYDPEGEGRG